MAAVLKYLSVCLAIILVWSGMLHAASRNPATDPLTLELTGSQAAQTMLGTLDRRGEKGPFILRQGSKDDRKYLVAFTQDKRRGAKAVRAFEAEYRLVEEVMIMEANPRISVFTVPLDGLGDYCARFEMEDIPKF